jgi:hypothetical protein
VSGRRRLGVVLAAALLLSSATACANGAGAGGTQQASSGGSDREAPVRGTVTSVTAASLTVLAEDGAVHNYRFGLATRVRRHGSDSSVAALHVGDSVSVFGGAGDSTVRRIVVRGAGSTAGADGGTPR